MPTSIRDAEEYLEKSMSFARVRKPQTKMVGSTRPREDGGWRIQLFLGADENLYERRRMTLGNGDKVERWFIVTSLTTERVTKDEERARQKSWKQTADQVTQTRSRAQRQAEKKRYDDGMCLYSIGVLFSDLLEELDFAIIAQLFNDDAQRVLRRVVRRVSDARILSYQITQPADPPKPAPEPEPLPNRVRAFLVPKDTIQ